MDRYETYSLESWGWVYEGTSNIIEGAIKYARAYSDNFNRVVKVTNANSGEELYRLSPTKPTMPHSFTTFYIIWSPTGPTPPRAQHYSREEADKVCQAMAGRHPRQEFYVMEAKARAKVNNVEFVDASEPESYNPF